MRTDLGYHETELAVWVVLRFVTALKSLLWTDEKLVHCRYRSISPVQWPYKQSCSARGPKQLCIYIYRLSTGLPLMVKRTFIHSCFYQLVCSILTDFNPSPFRVSCHRRQYVCLVCPAQTAILWIIKLRWMPKSTNSSQHINCRLPTEVGLDLMLILGTGTLTTLSAVKIHQQYTVGPRANGKMAIIIDHSHELHISVELAPAYDSSRQFLPWIFIRKMATEWDKLFNVYFSFQMLAN